MFLLTYISLNRLLKIWSNYHCQMKDPLYIKHIKSPQNSADNERPNIHLTPPPYILLNLWLRIRSSSFRIFRSFMVERKQVTHPNRIHGHSWNVICLILLSGIPKAFPYQLTLPIICVAARRGCLCVFACVCKCAFVCMRGSEVNTSVWVGL